MSGRGERFERAPSEGSRGALELPSPQRDRGPHRITKSGIWMWERISMGMDARRWMWNVHGEQGRAFTYLGARFAVWRLDRSQAGRPTQGKKP